MLEYIFNENGKIIDNLFKNLKYQSISEIVENILVIQNNEKEYLEERKEMVKKIQQLIIDSDEMEVLLSCEQVLGELFMKENYMNRQEIFEMVESDIDSLEKIFDNCLDD